MIKKSVVKSFVLVMAFSFLAGCSMFKKPESQIPSFSAKQFDTDMYTSKVENFLVLFDASSSMDKKYNGTKKIEIAKELVLRLNETVPELGQTAGLRSFGHAPTLSKMKTQLFYGIEKYASANLKDNFAKIVKPGGTSPLNLALDAAATDLKDLSGKIAIIIISDGLDLPGDPMASAKALKAVHGSSICFYPILVGDAPDNAVAGANEVVKIGGCGAYSTADELLTSAGMAGFVEKVFLTEKPAPVVEAAPVVKAVIPEQDSYGDGNQTFRIEKPHEKAGAEKINGQSFLS